MLTKGLVMRKLSYPDQLILTACVNALCVQEALQNQKPSHHHDEQARMAFTYNNVGLAMPNNRVEQQARQYNNKYE